MEVAQSSDACLTALRARNSRISDAADSAQTDPQIPCFLARTVSTCIWLQHTISPAQVTVCGVTNDGAMGGT